MNDIEELLKRPSIKNSLLGFLTIIISALCSSLGSWDNLNESFWIKAIIAALLTLLYILLLIFYSTNEVNERRIKAILEDRVKAYEHIMMGIDNICKQSANGVNDIIHNIITSGNFDPKVWSFDKACMLVCEQLYTLLLQLSGGQKDFGVAYVRLEENTKPETEIKMTGFANKNKQKPSIYEKKRKIDQEDEKNYHDVELFRRGKADMEVVIGHDRINDIFSYISKESRKSNKQKYNQYVAIPVFCNDTKMVGLLEVVSLNETIIGIDEKEVEELASKYFVPYSYMMLLLHKIEKAILAKPQGRIIP